MEFRDFKPLKVNNPEGTMREILRWRTPHCCRTQITLPYIKCFCRTARLGYDILVDFPNDGWINWTIFLCFWLTSGSRVLLRRPQPHSLPAPVVAAGETDKGPGWSADTCPYWCHPQPALPRAKRIPTSRGKRFLSATPQPPTPPHHHHCNISICLILRPGKNYI